ncbi:hypothetical protein N181_31005 [Sinorhizobium fredii USDA 205]|uniref:Uncharacterized protein n=1 Tax=Rhizobium fredii TaxID=380 RepID=A0A844A7Q3_RHIFR|nr:hypothetical protein [Sinorhizobium fredii]KSV91483.1 hypothetical protein N181_31005 [Sinorhizobium fredii USDA 205]MQX08062.1 hypothetical protein [Sinorhizobium fredii]GEC35696.1 hypothetical protein EFR01_58670 [Sinorhizobium fredii]GLS11901.1 hypothetical protein GCM10007864_55330 [Sinorhizobium fredii]
MPTERQTADVDEFGAWMDEVASALAWHGGDAEATIRTLLADWKHLGEQLALAQIATGLGFTRGWSPCPERQDEVTT